MFSSRYFFIKDNITDSSAKVDYTPNLNAYNNWLISFFLDITCILNIYFPGIEEIFLCALTDFGTIFAPNSVIKLVKYSLDGNKYVIFTMTIMSEKSFIRLFNDQAWALPVGTVCTFTIPVEKVIFFEKCFMNLDVFTHEAFHDFINNFTSENKILNFYDDTIILENTNFFWSCISPLKGEKDSLKELVYLHITKREKLYNLKKI